MEHRDDRILHAPAQVTAEQLQAAADAFKAAQLNSRLFAAKLIAAASELVQWRQAHPTEFDQRDQGDFERLKEAVDEATRNIRDEGLKLTELATHHLRLLNFWSEMATYLPLAIASATSSPDSITIALEEDRNCEIHMVPYKETAETLQDAAEVVSLAAAIKRLDGLSGAPFIALENSSGMGKTQMAFNLMVRGETHGDMDVLYFVCSELGDPPGVQLAYTAFQSRSGAFLTSIKQDVKECDVRGARVEDIAKCERLYTYGLLCTLLAGDLEVTIRKGDKSAALALLAARKRQLIVFLDEFQPLPSDRDYAGEESNSYRIGGDNSVRELRFMRNVFRSLGLVVILSSTSCTTRRLFDPVDPASLGSDGLQSLSLWCVVFPSLPRFRDDLAIETADVRLTSILRNSRLPFARKVLKLMREQPTLTTKGNLVDFVDTLADALATMCSAWKDPSLHWFRVGQICLLLGSSAAAVVAGDDAGHHLIKRHFARLEEREAFRVSIDAHGQLYKQLDGHEQLWAGRCVLPSPDEDVLLYLALTGGKKFRPLVSADEVPVPVHQALAELERSQRKMLRLDLATTAGSLKRLEALVAGSVVLASHIMGLGGPTVGAFLVALLYELDLDGRSPRTADMRFSANIQSLCSMRLSFLAPLDVYWPAFLPLELAATLASLESVMVRVTDRVQLQTSDGLLSVECWNWTPRMLVSDEMVKGPVGRIPQSSKVHLVVANRLPLDLGFGGLYGIDGQKEELEWVQHAQSYRVGRRGDWQKLHGFGSRQSQLQSGSAQEDRLVMFVELQ